MPTGIYNRNLKKYRILATGQIENLDIYTEIAKQIIQPDVIDFYVDENPAQGIDNRRMQIVENHKRIRQLVKHYEPDLVWQLEGDAVLEPNTLRKLLRSYDGNVISGIQINRHGIYNIGAWHVAKDRNSFESVDYRLKGVQEVDAVGFYCLLAPADVWLKGKCEWNGERWGPDVAWGLSLTDEKCIIKVDMNVKIGHRISSGIIHPDYMSTCNVKFTKNDQGWSYKTESY